MNAQLLVCLLNISALPQEEHVAQIINHNPEVLQRVVNVISNLFEFKNQSSARESLVISNFTDLLLVLNNIMQVIGDQPQMSWYVLSCFATGKSLLVPKSGDGKTEYNSLIYEC